MRAAAITLWAVAVGLALWLATAVGGAPDRSAADLETPERPGRAGDAVSDAHPRRRQVDAAGDAGAAQRASFDEYVERLVELGVRMWDLVENGEPEAAREIDVEARVVLRKLHNRTAAPGEKALHRLCGLLSEDTTIRGRVRRKVLLRILDDALEARWDRTLHGGSRAPVNQLVESMLRVIPQDEVLARDLGAGLLVAKPYLDAVHEPAVLEVADAVSEQPYLLPVACALLLTLWENLGESGARSAGSLASLALLFKDDVDLIATVCNYTVDVAGHYGLAF